MSQSKSWKLEEDLLIQRLVQEHHSKEDIKRVKWQLIAKQVNDKVAQCKKTGKQCRQRWHNHINPKIRKDIEWTDTEQKMLFQLHNDYGNKWAVIAKQLEGRTDNCVKNHFYSTIRKAMRRINKFITQMKRRNKKDNIKQFKPIVLNKILAVADSKYEEKLQVKDPALILSKTIKNQLIQLAKQKQQYEYENIDEQCLRLRKDLINNIQQFNRNCKRRKGKRKLLQPSTKQKIEQQQQQISQQLQNDDQIEEQCQCSLKQQQQQQYKSPLMNKPSTKPNNQTKIINMNNNQQPSSRSYQLISDMGSSFISCDRNLTNPNDTNNMLFKSKFLNGIKTVQTDQNGKSCQKDNKKLEESLSLDKQLFGCDMLFKAGEFIPGTQGFNMHGFSDLIKSIDMIGTSKQFLMDSRGLQLSNSLRFIDQLNKSTQNDLNCMNFMEGQSKKSKKDSE